MQPADSDVEIMGLIDNFGPKNLEAYLIIFILSTFFSLSKTSGLILQISFSPC